MVVSSIIFVWGVEKVGKEEEDVEHWVRVVPVCVSPRNNPFLNLLPSFLNPNSE